MSFKHLSVDNFSFPAVYAYVYRYFTSKRRKRYVHRCRFHCQTTDTGLVHRAVCLFTSQLSLVLIARTHGGIHYT